MIKKAILLLAVVILCFAKLNAQDQEVIDINNFIKEHSKGINDFWPNLRIKNDNLIIYNLPNMRTLTFTFPIDKINTDNIDFKKDRIYIKSNSPGNNVTFFSSREEMKNEAFISLRDINNKDKKQLVEMLSSYLKKYQNKINQIVDSKIQDTDKSKFNQMIVNFFINLELTNKNHNLSAIYNYVPDNIEQAFSKINISSNLAGQEENIVFMYDEINRLKGINYTVKRFDKDHPILFRYDIINSNKYTSHIYLKDKPAYQFLYNDGMVEKVIIFQDETQSIYNVKLDENGNRINLFLDVKTGGKTYTSQNVLSKNVPEDFIIWKDNFKIDSYSFDIYSATNFKYDSRGNVLSFKYSDVLESDQPTKEWNFTFDKNGNWIVQKNEFFNLKRSFE